MKILRLNFGGTFAGGFLSFKASIPKSLLLSGKHTIGSHFTLVNYQVCMYQPDPFHFCIFNRNYDVISPNLCCTRIFQIKQIRTALAIASLLNRTLVRTIFWDNKILIRLPVELQSLISALLSIIVSIKYC